MTEDALVYVFSQGQFIQAVRSLVIDTGLPELDKMRKFWGQGSPAIADAELVELSFEAGAWRRLPTKRLYSCEFDDRGSVGQGHPVPGRLPPHSRSE
ncbi:hypothetical protein [Terriglobus sp.]|uniref:hypothetical protein n=1 Tax=Terriglobus sp. TaxID=1889013 RepID=UPI003B008059